LFKGKRKREEGRRKKEEGRKLMVLGMKKSSASRWL
jgi:hypothetical protein